MPAVTLLDGRQVDSASEEWRAECEARDLVQRRSYAFRKEYLINVERSRGPKVADQLRDLVLKMWEERPR